jgi:hypothetical protein
VTGQGNAQPGQNLSQDDEPTLRTDYLDLLAATLNDRNLPIFHAYIGPFDPTKIATSYLYAIAGTAVWSGNVVAFDNDASIVHVGAPRLFLPAAGAFSQGHVGLFAEEVTGWDPWAASADLLAFNRLSYGASRPISSFGNDPDDTDHIPEPGPVMVEESWFEAIEQFVAGSDLGEFSTWYGEDE